MPQDHTAKTTGFTVRPFNTDKVFLMVSDPFRRRVIRSLAGGEMKLASDLGSPSGTKRHNQLKHLTALCNAGILVQKENPRDGRKPLFALASSVVVCKGANSLTIGFGRCMLRFD
jgi:hypothetical protein